MLDAMSTPGKPLSDKRDGTVQSVERALGLLEALGQDEDGLRLTDLAQRCALSASTTHRLLTTLQKRRFVEFDKTDGLWHVGRQAFAVGSAFTRRRNFVAVAIPFLRTLRDRTRETANLGIIEDGELVTLAQVESREIMRATSMVGGRSPVYATGMGKAILSTYPADAVPALLPSGKWRKLTPKTLSGEAAFLATLEAVRSEGYAVDDEEFLAGLRCVAAPVFDHDGDATFAVSISGLSSRVNPDRIPAIGALVKETAQAISRALGGSHPAGKAKRGQHDTR